MTPIEIGHAATYALQAVLRLKLLGGLDVIVDETEAGALWRRWMEQAAIQGKMASKNVQETHATTEGQCGIQVTTHHAHTHTNIRPWQPPPTHSSCIIISHCRI